MYALSRQVNDVGMTSEWLHADGLIGGFLGRVQGDHGLKGKGSRVYDVPPHIPE